MPYGVAGRLRVSVSRTMLIRAVFPVRVRAPAEPAWSRAICSSNLGTLRRVSPAASVPHLWTTTSAGTTWVVRGNQLSPLWCSEWTRAAVTH